MSPIRLLAPMIAAVMTIPALLDAAERSAVLASPEGGAAAAEPRTTGGMARRADRLLSAGRYAQAAAVASRVLEQAPLDRRALRILAMAEEGQGDLERAGEVAIDASFVSRRDPYTQVWMYRIAADAGDFDEAARSGDALSRVEGFRPEGFARLDILLGSPRGDAAVAKRLAAKPAWRAPFLEWLSADRQRSERALPLLAALARTSAPASASERASVFQRMIAVGEGARAYAFWRGQAPRRAEAIADPDLQNVQVPSGGIVPSPFAWTAASEAMVSVAGDRDSSGRPALAVEPAEDRSAMFVAVHLGAAPGRYTLGYAASGPPEQLDRLHPDLLCPGTGRLSLEPLASASSGGERRTRLAAVVPPGCGLVTLGFTFEPSTGGTLAAVAIRAVSFAPGG